MSGRRCNRLRCKYFRPFRKKVGAGLKFPRPFADRYNMHRNASRRFLAVLTLAVTFAVALSLAIVGAL